MKIVLCVCPCYSIVYPPLSLAILAATLKSKRYDATNLDFNIQLYNEVSREDREAWWDLGKAELWRDKCFVEHTITKERMQRWADQILEMKPDIVGFTIYSSNLLASLMLSEQIKLKREKVKTIFGGPFCRRDNDIAQTIIQNEAVDIIAVGEGELILEEVVGSYNNKNMLEYCKGTILKHNGKIIDCGVRDPIQDLNSLPFPNFSDFDLNLYEEKLIPLLGSRGCLYNCAFCDEKAFWGRYRYREGANIIEEIKSHIANYGVRTFRFNDLLMNGNLGELERFCDQLISEDIEIKWGGYMTVRKMHRGLIEKMKKSGCYFIFFGIESGSQGILNRFKEGVTTSVTEELLRCFYEIGICVHTGWIVGFPNESFCDFKHTIDFIERNKRYMDFIAPASQLTIPYGSRISKYPSEFGVKDIAHPGDWSDITTSARIRKARLDYFNKKIARIKINLSEKRAL